MELRPRETDQAFEDAMQAYKDEMARNLRSPSAWGVQVSYVVLGLLKAASVLLVCVIAVVASGLFGSFGVTLGLFMGLLVLPVGVMIFPGWFIHNVFAARAWAAFDAAIERGRP